MAMPHGLWWDEVQKKKECLQAGVVWSISPLDGAEARNRAVPGMRAIQTVSTKHNLYCNFILIKKYVLVKLFILYLW